MASLVEPLANGFAAAASGTAEFYRQGTSSLQDVYSDAEAVTAVTSHILDSAGKLSRYVKGRTDVVVKNSVGATVATFTAGGDAREVRVENAGFTGTYANGTTGPGGRTTVDEVLSSAYASLGATDWRVNINGVLTSLGTAIGSSAGIVYNVKNYGAVGDDIANDFGSIGAAITAAEANGGGIIFFPPGTYAITNGGTGYNLTAANEKYVFMGAAESAVTLKFYSNSVDGNFVTGNSNITFENITFSYSNSAFIGEGMITTAGTGRVTARACTFNGHAGAFLFMGSTAVFVAFGCTFQANSGGYFTIGTARFFGCKFSSSANSWLPFRGTGVAQFSSCDITHTGVSASFISNSGMTGQFTGSLVDVSGATGTFNLAVGGASIVAAGCRFTGGGGVTANLVAATGRVIESGNTFTTFGLGTPTGLLLSQSRDNQLDETSSLNVTTTSGVTPNAMKGTYYIGVVAATAIVVTINAPSNDPGASAAGTRFSIVIRNTGASACTIAWNATYIGGAAGVLGGSDLVTSLNATTGHVTSTFVRSAAGWVVVR